MHLKGFIKRLRVKPTRIDYAAFRAIRTRHPRPLGDGLADSGCASTSGRTFAEVLAHSMT